MEIENLNKVWPIFIWIGIIQCLQITGHSLQEFPPTHFTENPVGTTVLEGTTQTLYCRANGNPIPRYTWYRNGHLFVENITNTFMTVFDMKLSDAGEYHCVARNRLGAVLSKRVHVHVAYMNSFISNVDRTVRVNQGDAVFVKLPPIDSYPTPTITWNEGDTPPPKNERYYETLNSDYVILESRLEDDNMVLRAKAENLFTKTAFDSPSTTVRIQHVGSSYSHIPPKFIVPPEDTIARIGDWSTTLECVINARPIEHLQVNWYKNRGRKRQLIESGFKYKISNHRRLLTIKHPGALDAGVYECEGALIIPGGPRYSPVSVTANLEVYSAPALVTESPANISRRTGDEVIIDCPVDAFPKPSIAWYKDGIALSVGLGTRYEVMENKSLRMDSIHRDDAGVYQCFALNVAGEVDYVTALRITMRTEIDRPPQDTRVLKGQTTVLKCGAKHANHVKIRISWLLNDSRVRVHDPRIRILDDGSLRIFSVRPDETGVYTCQVHSVMGNDSKSAKLLVLSLPESPTIDTVTLSPDSDRNVDIKWTPRSDGNSAIKYFIIQYRAVPKGRHGFMGVWEGWQPLATKKTVDLDTFKYTAEDLIPGKTYQFHISAVNRVGEGRPSPASRPITLPAWHVSGDLGEPPEKESANQISTPQKGQGTSQRITGPIHITTNTRKGGTTVTMTSTNTRQNTLQNCRTTWPPEQTELFAEVLNLNREKLRLEKNKLQLEMEVLRLQRQQLVAGKRHSAINVNCFGHKKGELLSDHHDDFP